MQSGEPSVYGASLAGGSFDFIKFVKQPQTILRFLSWVFAIVVFATITAEGYANPPNDPELRCIFNLNDGACHYGVGIGIIAFFVSVVFLFADAYFPMMSSVQDRRRLVIADLAFSGVWTFLWFVCFCLLANQWANTTDIKYIPTDAAHAIIAFSFFSTASWAGLTFMAFVRFRQGTSEMGQSFSESASDPASTYPSPYIQDPSAPYHATSYPSFPNAHSDLYHQQPPFTGRPDQIGSSDYQPPSY